ncbi:MAG: glycosyltransferase [Streptococcaceae bacterium]|jgi:glycosyltransferase involved in cell wall biosynthesis|nr:glycosyltransferase [Streptococcaceae bacterium]
MLTNTENPLISLIIPIYNVEQYLTACLESVQAQTYQNLEVLLINDGSNDKSSEIAQKFADANVHFTLFNKKNGGLSDARNFGIEHCKGDYLVFMDSDDLVSPYYVENLYEAIHQTEVKLAMCKMTRNRTELNDKAVTSLRRVSGTFENRIKALGINQDLMPNDAAWDKIYHRTLFKAIRYPKGQVFEDSSVIFPLLDAAGDYAVVDSVDYFYRPNAASITGQAQIKQGNFDLLLKNQRQVDFLAEKHPEALPLGLANVLNANDFWAQIAVKDKSELAAEFFDQLWRQNKDYSRNSGLRKLLYVNKSFYRFLIVLASGLYGNRVFKGLMKHLLMRNS